MGKLLDAICGNPEAIRDYELALAESYERGRAAGPTSAANRLVMAELVRLREFMIRIDALPPGASVLDAKAIAREALRE